MVHGACFRTPFVFSTRGGLSLAWSRTAGVGSTGLSHLHHEDHNSEFSFVSCLWLFLSICAMLLAVISTVTRRITSLATFYNGQTGEFAADREPSFFHRSLHQTLSLKSLRHDVNVHGAIITVSFVSRCRADLHAARLLSFSNIELSGTLDACGVRGLCLVSSFSQGQCNKSHPVHRPKVFSLCYAATVALEGVGL